MVCELGRGAAVLGWQPMSPLAAEAEVGVGKAAAGWAIRANYYGLLLFTLG